LAIVLASTMLGLVACGPGAEKLGEWYGGDALIARVTALQRKAEILVLALDSQPDALKFLRITPAEGNELVVAYVEVINQETSRIVLTLDTGAAELDTRKATAEEYHPIDVFARGEPTEEFGEGETYYAPILWDQVDLLKEHQLVGWMVFEVPKGERFRQMVWRASDTIFIEF
jgi:hypothetical protein